MIHRHKFVNRDQFLAQRNELHGRGNPKLFRLGASDIPTIYRIGDRVGLNEYVSPTVFFFDCCDFAVRENVSTPEMTRGNIQEPVIYSEYWRLFDPEHPTEEAWLANWNGPRTKFRSAMNLRSTIINDKYDWICVTPDYIINKNPYTPKGPLELKSPSSRANDKYEAGIATQYIIQNHVQMLVLGFNYGELFAVTDATHPILYQLEQKDNIKEAIIESSREFVELVLKGKKIVYSKKGGYDYKLQKLSEIGPKDDGNPLFTEFLKERHKPENAKATLQGTGEQLDIVVQFLREKRDLKPTMSRILELENKIRMFFKEGVGYIEWPDLGRIGWVEKFNVPKDLLDKFEAAQ